MQAHYLSAREAREFYDRFGARQDRQAFYEDPALELMLAHADLRHAASVVEFGCGTGRLAERMLAREMSETARYAGTDISPQMLRLATQRLSRFGQRAKLWLSEGAPDLAPADPPVDRIVTTYVLDLLPPDTIAAFLDAAHGALAPGGLLAAVSLGRGCDVPSRLTAKAWGWVARHRPALVGGCRPLALAEMLPADRWRIDWRDQVAAWTIPSEIVVAARIS